MKVMSMPTHKTAKRELIDTGTNTLYVRRNERGTSFTEAVDAGRLGTACGSTRSGSVPVSRAD